VAGRPSSEETDAVAFDDVTPPRPVSIYDLDEDIPTRMQSSDEIAEFQRKARERKDPTHKSFRKANEPVSTPSGRPIPRESGPVVIERPKPPPPDPAEPDLDLDQVLNEVAATISQIPPKPRVPRVEQRGVSEPAHDAETRAVPAQQVPPQRGSVVGAVLLFVLTLAAVATVLFTR